MIDLAGKTAVVFGLANKRSIAWGIAQKLHEAGATLAICYQNERMKARGREPHRRAARRIRLPVRRLQRRRNRLPLRRHQAEIRQNRHPRPRRSLRARRELRGEFINTSREGFRIALDVSVYSLIAVSRAAAPLMTEGGSIITLSFLRR